MAGHLIRIKVVCIWHFICGTGQRFKVPSRMEFDLSIQIKLALSLYGNVIICIFLDSTKPTTGGKELSDQGMNFWTSLHALQQTSSTLHNWQNIIIAYPTPPRLCALIQHRCHEHKCLTFQGHELWSALIDVQSFSIGRTMIKNAKEVGCRMRFISTEKMSAQYVGGLAIA